ncbi:hypothetical protein [Archangium sp.]|jgi:hypothetical protein|uniref:hypothetical protein n=1 Tax=Archangium sp. TaxID=1872627 RepID=UPI002ED82300
MRNMGVKGLLGALAGVALLAGCGEGMRKDGGRTWSLTAQEDYYSEQAQDEVGKERSNIGTSSTLYQTNEQERGTGGAGEPQGGGQENILPGGPGRDPAQANLWLRQDERVPFPPDQFESLAALDIGTGKPLKTGRNGAWIQGTYGIEVGSGLASSIAPSTGSSFQPQEPTEGSNVAPMRNAGENEDGKASGYIRP